MTDKNRGNYILGESGVGPEYLNTEEAAELLRIHKNSLLRLNKQPGGPPRSRLGRAVRYGRRDLIAWMDSRREPPLAR